MNEPIVLTSYDETWPQIYAHEAKRLRDALPMDVVMATEHIGSTAVPGLVAKPIVDIMLGIRATHLAPNPETLRQLGYELGHPEDHSPDWVYYVKRNQSGRRVAHLHIVVHEGAYWNKWLYFRDRLRSDPSLAREYVALKQELASTYRHDRLGYTFGKDRFVAQAIGPWNEMGLREEQLGDVDGIRTAHSAAFGRVAEADLVDQLRDGGFIVSSLVAVLNGRCVGNVVFSRIAISGADGDIPAVVLAPVAVLPEHQRSGIGTKLIEAGLERCRSLGRTVALVLGHPDYYRRFGFSAELAKRIDGPYSGEAWMALELQPNALPEGALRVTYPAAFDAVD